MDLDVGCGCNSMAATTTSQELSPSTAHAEPQVKKHQCGNNILNTFEEKKNKIEIPGKRCTKIYTKKQSNGKNKEIA